MEQNKAVFLLDPSHTVQKTPREISVAAGQTIMQALNSHEIGFRQPVIVLVNGQTRDVSYYLQPGDVVRFFPQIAGGCTLDIVGKTFQTPYDQDVLDGKRAYTGKILHINLTGGRIWVDQPDEAFYRRLIGGRGFVLHYLLNEMPAGVDPLSPENLLIFAPGVLSGTVLPGTGRHAVGAKSPLTGALASGEAGGW